MPHVLPGTWAGHVRVGSLDVASTPARVLGGVAGLVFQDPESQLVMPRVDDEVAFGLENRGWPPDRMRARVPEALRLVGLSGFEDRSTVRLSGGEQQRLAIADVLAPLPGLLVLDEPTANLDPPGVHAVFDRLAAIVAERTHTVVLVEHRVEAALPLADAVLALDRSGAVIAFGTPDEVARHADAIARSGAWIPRAWSTGSRSAERMPALAAHSPGDPLLAAEGLSVAYPAERGGWRPALVEAGVSLGTGERVAVVGPNGSGKSTLLFTLAGLRRPDAGRVRIARRDGTDPADPARLPSSELASRVGFAFQDPELAFVGTTVRQELAASLAIGSEPEAPEADEWLERIGLAGLGDESPYRLSQGEQRRLSVAAAAATRPGVLILDEPTFALDRGGSDDLLALLDSLRRDGSGQLIATHDLRLLPTCDRVVALDGGRVVLDGPADAFLAAPPYRPPGSWRLPA